MPLKNSNIEDFIPLMQVEVAEIFPKHDGAAILVADNYYYVALLKNGWVLVYPIIRGKFIEWCIFDYFAKIICEKFGDERAYKLLMEFQGAVPD